MYTVTIPPGKNVQVRDLIEARKAYLNGRDSLGLPESAYSVTTAIGDVTDENGKFVAHLDYQGRCWVDQNRTMIQVSIS